MNTYYVICNKNWNTPYENGYIKIYAVNMDEAFIAYRKTYPESGVLPNFAFIEESEFMKRFCFKECSCGPCQETLYGDTWHTESWNEDDIKSGIEDLIGEEKIPNYKWLIHGIKKDAAAAFSDYSLRNEILKSIIENNLNDCVSVMPVASFKAAHQNDENIVWLERAKEGGNEAILLKGYLEFAGTAEDYPRYTECEKDVTNTKLSELFDDFDDVRLYIYDNGTDRKEVAEWAGTQVELIDGKWYYKPTDLIEDSDITVDADERLTAGDVFQILDGLTDEEHDKLTVFIQRRRK